MLDPNSENPEPGTAAAAEDSDGSPLPSWIRNHEAPFKDAIIVLSTSSDEEEFQSQPPARAQDADAAGGEPLGVETQPSDVPSSQAAPQGEGSKQATYGRDAKAGPSGSLSAEEAAKSGAVTRSELAIMIPERLNRNKVIVELEPAEHGATDLSGDSGAVGRLIVTGKPGSEEIRIDLKGIVYKASILPLAGTMCVINIGQTDAKVEALCTDFIRLKEESNFYAAEAVMEGTMMEEDVSDDEPAAVTAAGDKATAPAGEKLVKKAAGSKDAFKALLKGAGGVQKKAVKRRKDSKASHQPASSKAGAKVGKAKAAAPKKAAAGAKKAIGSKIATKK